MTTMLRSWWKRAALTAALLVASAVLLVWLYGDWLITQAYRVTLEEPSRVASLQIDRVIEVLEIGPGQRVVDLGAGTGVFARPFAQAMSEGGIVYAVDVNRELLEHIGRTAEEEGIANILTVLADDDDPLIPEPVDLIFICDTLHHIPHRDSYVATLRRYLKPGGRVAVLDFQQGNSPHLMGSMKYTLEELDRWMLDAGYTVAGRHDFIDDNFFVVYRCESCPDR
jgi:ubiquinone/menaquinone biosynthesis C-methylase UbiE